MMIPVHRVEQESTDEQSFSGEDSSNVSEDDYRIPKTVYIGVDSIAAPKVPPESVAEDQTPMEDQSITPTAAQPAVQTEQNTAAQESSDTQALTSVESLDTSENNDEPAATTETALAAQPSTEDQLQSGVAQDSQSNESDNAKKDVVAAVVNEKPKAPEIKQAKTNSINNVSKRITLFKSIDVESELDVPSGLPKDLTEDQDHREEVAAAAAQTTELPETESEEIAEASESETATADNAPDAAEQAESEQATDRR